MMSNRFPGRTVLAGLATLALGGACALAQADQPPQPRYFSFVKTAPTISESNISAIHVLVTSEQSQGRESILESYWGPKFTVPAHFHKYHSEIFILLSGHLEWTIGGETHIIGPGDAVFIPPDTVHSVHVVGDGPAHVIFIQEPGGYENVSAYEASFTPAEKKNAKLAKQLNALADFNPVNPRK